MKPDRFIAGDALRGLGALAVFVVHAAAAAIILTGSAELLTRNTDSPAGFLEAFGTVLGSLIVAGPFGFLIFFVLSGYLIGWPFVRAVIDGRPLPSLRTYTRNRVLRVVPAYWAVLTAIVLIFVVIAGDVRPPVDELAALYAFQVSADNPLGYWIAQAWTLAVEFKFYVGLPLAAVVASPLLRRLPGRRARTVAIALPCLVWFVAASFVYDGRAQPGEPFLYFLRMLAAGVAIAALEPAIRARVEGSRRWAKIATVSFVVCVGYVLAAGALYEVGSPFDRSVGSVLFDVAIVGLVLAPLLRQWSDGGCWRALDNAVTRALGVRSYSFYLVHNGMLVELGTEIGRRGYGYKESFALLMTGGFVASLALAELLYRGVERPMLARKQRRGAPSADPPPAPSWEAAEPAQPDPRLTSTRP